MAKLKRYRVSLQVSQDIYAESKDEALDIFHDDLNENMSTTEMAEAVEIKTIKK